MRIVIFLILCALLYPLARPLGEHIRHLAELPRHIAAIQNVAHTRTEVIERAINESVQ